MKSFRVHMIIHMIIHMMVHIIVVRKAIHG